MRRDARNAWTSAALVVVVIVASAAFTSVAVDPVFAGDDDGKGGPAGATQTKAKLPVIPAGAPSAEAVEAGKQAFADVARVLQSPRCRNCHPVGDAPLQTDQGRPHRMNITRKSVKAGLLCSTCHQDKNSEVLGITGGPPGAPHWNLPPEKTPMVFEGRSARQLCEQFNDPKQTGDRSLMDLWHHVAEDPLVLWGWNPGGKRTVPPITHERFVEAFGIWVESKGACP